MASIPESTLLVIEDRLLLAESLCRAFTDIGIGCALVTVPDLDEVRSTLDRIDAAAALVAVGFGHGTMTEDVVGELASRGIPTVIMTGGRDRLRLARCIAEGAIGIIDRSASFETVAATLKEISGTTTLLSPEEIYRLQDELRRHRAAIEARRKPFSRLTARESEVLEQLANGYRADEIAERSFVSVSTVRSQIRGVLTKLGVSSQLAAVAMAHRAGVFDPESAITRTVAS